MSFDDEKASHMKAVCRSLELSRGEPYVSKGGYRSDDKFQVSKIYSLGLYSVFLVAWAPTQHSQDQNEAGICVWVKEGSTFRFEESWYCVLEGTPSRTSTREVTRRIKSGKWWWPFYEKKKEVVRFTVDYAPHSLQEATALACSYAEMHHGLTEENSVRITELMELLTLRQRALDELTLTPGQAMDRELGLPNPQPLPPTTERNA